ncbi:MAG TPA: DNA methyltransferase, partial [Gemmatimonadaceae bacterium]|nr:DNA methyltransferase [Gemmatimonadaceae bacterium]
PLAVRNRTLAKNLAHKTIVDDSADAGNAGADYLLLFRRKGENATPIAHPTGFHEYIGATEIPAELAPFKAWTGDQKLNRFSHWIWRRYASSFWDDIRLDRVLPFREARDEEDEKHVHPLQLDVIERACHMWTNPGEVVLTPFMGVGSEVFGAVSCGRRALGCELKTSYFRQAVKNLNEAVKIREASVKQPTLFSE